MTPVIHKERDDSRIAAALELPVAALYRGRGFEHQTVRFLCGPASVANLLRSFGDPVEPRRLLDDTEVSTFFGFRGGTTLDQLAHVVRAKSARRATVLRDLTLDAFREHLLGSNDPARRYIVNFHRGALFGWGGGHHSPIAGYLEADDLALILDVNRRVGPWLASAPRLFSALSTVDPSTRQRRGLLLVE